MQDPACRKRPASLAVSCNGSFPTRVLIRWPVRKPASLVRCEECHCISEDARDWIAKLIDDDEEAESSVVLYCPACEEWEFERQPRSR